MADCKDQAVAEYTLTKDGRVRDVAPDAPAPKIHVVGWQPGQEIASENALSAVFRWARERQTDGD